MPRTVLVTGAAGGVGRSIAEGFAGEGDRVIGLDIGVPEGAGYPFVSCDLRDPAAIGRTMADLEAAHGPLDVLVNNAAYCGQSSFFELTAEEINRTLAVNVTAPLLLCQHFVAQRRRAGGGGAVVNIASFAGRRGSSQIEYGASKAGVINLTVTLARLLGPEGIRVNAVAPALVEAGMGVRLSDRVRGGFLSNAPLGRGSTPEEVANVVLFLASDKASYVSGETIDVFGGL